MWSEIWSLTCNEDKNVEIPGLDLRENLANDQTTKLHGNMRLSFGEIMQMVRQTNQQGWKKNLGCSFIQHNPTRNPCTHKSMRMVWGYIAHAVTGRRSASRGLAPHGGEEKGFKVTHRTNTHTGERISECVCWWFVYVGSYWRRSIFNLWSVLFTFLLFPPSWLCMLHMCGTVDMLSGLLVFPNYTILTSVFHCMSWIMYLLTCFCCSTASQTYRTCATRVCFCMSVNF